MGERDFSLSERRRGQSYYLRLTLPLVLLSGLLGVVFVEAQEELFVANTLAQSITVYSRTANGNIAPRRTISGPATGLNNPLGLVVGGQQASAGIVVSLDYSKTKMILFDWLYAFLEFMGRGFFALLLYFGADRPCLGPPGA